MGILCELAKLDSVNAKNAFHEREKKSFGGWYLLSRSATPPTPGRLCA